MPTQPVPYPENDDPTDEVAPIERLMRRYAPGDADAPALTIDEEVEREGIEDRDPFEEFPPVPPDALVDPLAEAGPDLVELDAAALEPLAPEAPRRR